jgi:uncharacterized protein (DUF697 family)
MSIDELSTEISKKLGAAKRERWYRGAKAYSEKFLSEKRKACENHITIAAAASAANALNPIPGTDTAVDISILIALFKDIRDTYGLTDSFLHKLQQSAIPIVKNLASNVAKYTTQGGILILLKEFAGRQTTKEFTKYIPIVGQLIAASLGFLITQKAGEIYLNYCHDLAKEILKINWSPKHVVVFSHTRCTCWKSNL